MNTIRFILLLAFVCLGLPSLSQAQIRDNESSVIALAVQCAISSGFSAEDYEDYSRSLAKTLSLLSNAQQARVFGYLPRPAGSASDGEAGPTTPSQTGSSPVSGTPVVNEGGEETGSLSGGGSSIPDVGNAPTGTVVSDPGLLVNLIRRLNETINGTTSGATPVVAGSTGVEFSGSTVPVTGLTEIVTPEKTETNTGTRTRTRTGKGDDDDDDDDDDNLVKTLSPVAAIK